jgi:hypothetical protein
MKRERCCYDLGGVKTAATRRAYRTDFAIFEAWCAERGAAALPASPETVAALQP